jgi:PAS domain S-box-containing protein
MFVAPYLNPRTPVTVDFSANLGAAFVAFVLGASAMLHYGAENRELHTVLDTGVAVTGALIALSLWDVSRRTEQSWALFLAICFAMTAISEFLHVVTVLGWFGKGPAGDVTSRAGSWGPRAYLLPISVWAALLLRNRPRWFAWPLAAGLALLAAALIAIFQVIPRYAQPGLFWVTRPSLILVPLVWALAGVAYWKRRNESDIASAIAPVAVILAAAHGAMLYARAPADTAAMVAHYGKFIGDGLLLFNLTQIGAADTARRRQVEQQLIELNRDLDARVAERTAAQRRSQDMIEAIIANSPALIYVKDLAGLYLMVNQRFAETFQVEREQVIGKSDHDLFDHASADAYRAMDQRVAAADRPLTEEETFPLEDGPHTWLSVKAPLHDDAGRAYAVFGISTDVTDQRRAQVALRDSEQRNRLIVESALDAVVTIDSAGVITGWSPHAETTFGWTQDEALGKPVDELILPERYRAAKGWHAISPPARRGCSTSGSSSPPFTATATNFPSSCPSPRWAWAKPSPSPRSSATSPTASWPRHGSRRSAIACTCSNRSPARSASARMSKASSRSWCARSRIGCRRISSASAATIRSRSCSSSRMSAPAARRSAASSASPSAPKSRSTATACRAASPASWSMSPTSLRSISPSRAASPRTPCARWWSSRSPPRMGYSACSSSPAWPLKRSPARTASSSNRSATMSRSPPTRRSCATACNRPMTTSNRPAGHIGAGTAARDRPDGERHRA